MEEYCHELKIPKERVAVLIGRSGEVKKSLEEGTGVKIDINSIEGDVSLKGEDPITLFTMREVVKAIGRGFNPDIARQLLKPDYSFEMVNLTDFAKTKNHALRLKGRVIGTGGKARSTIESLCDVSLSVYGKTISVIGQAENVATAKKAVESLLLGRPHAKVYRWLELQRRNLKKLI